MTSRPVSSHRGSPRRGAGWLLAALVAIPFVSVTSVALLADVASTTDPMAMVVGIPALLVGVVAAYLSARVIRGMHNGAVALRVALRRLSAAVDAVVLQVATALRSPTEGRTDLLVAPVVVGRRGPPFSSR